MQTNTNSYTVIYAFLMAVLVGSALALVAYSLKPIQKAEEDLEKKTNILKCVSKIEKANADAIYGEKIKELVINSQGKVVEGVAAFDLELKKELKKSESEMNLPLYLYSQNGKQQYILPIRGAGLWDAIWGYIALDSDKSTIVGAVFDHKAETPGLGAEITKDWFQDQFKGKKVATKGKQQNIKVLKGQNNNIDGKPQDVNGMSGATITGDGVQAMINSGLSRYMPYLNSVK